MMLSDLQLALIGLGATAVASVWGYNKWQERGHRKLAERIVSGGATQDVLLGNAPEATVTDEADVRVEPGLGGGESVRSADVPASPWADEVADAVAHIEFSNSVTASALWTAQSAWADHVAKSLHWVGEVDGAWHLLTPQDAGRYSKVMAALQLADRRGVVSEADLETFVSGVGTVATQLAGVAVMPDIDGVIDRARALDDFCASVDFQLAVHVASTGEPFVGTKLRGLAEAAGMQLGDDGRFHLRDDTGHTLYTLGNVGVELFDAETLRVLTTPAVTFSLDVPNVAQGPRVFDRMVSAARALALALDGTLVDAQHGALTDEMIAGIRARIDELQARMTTHRIAAGSPRALRLFS